MADKVDRKSVDLIVHNKYEDIVDYLQQGTIFVELNLQGILDCF